MKTGVTSLFIIGLSTLMAACGGPHQPEASKTAASPVTKVKIGLAKIQERNQVYKASGTVRALTTAPLSSKIMGTIVEVRVRAGDRVKAGQLLAVIDGRETEAMVQKSEAGMQEARMGLREIEKSLEAAQANLQLANTTLKRFQELADQKSVSPQEFDEVRARQHSAAAGAEALEARKQQILARIQQAQSDVQNSQALRSYAQIRSPLNGVVVQRQAEPGSLAVPGMPLLTVEETGHYRLEVPVEETQISRLQLGKAVEVNIDALKSPNVQGTVAEIQPSADPASRTYLVKIHLPAHPELRTGMYGEARFDVGLRRGMWVPRQSILQDGQLEGVFVVGKDTTARLRLLKLGESTAEEVEVLAGLDEGESYVADGTALLRDGSRVEVVR